MKSRFKRVCVFCGSSSGNRECYRDAAIDLAQELVRLSLCYNESLETFEKGLDFFFFCLSLFYETDYEETESCVWGRKHWSHGFGLTSCS